LSKNIGRYVKYDLSKVDKKQIGSLAANGIIYEIVDIQKHYGYVDGKYVPDKIGYRVKTIGIENDFGRPMDVDNLIFVNDMTEDEARNINQKIYNKLT